MSIAVKEVETEKSITDSSFIQQWMQAMKDSLALMIPNIDDYDIDSELLEMIDEYLIDSQCDMHNNYVDRKYDTTLLNIIDWIEKKKPIIAGSGVLYKQHNEALNINGKMLMDFISRRKLAKKEIFKHEKILTDLNIAKEQGERVLDDDIEYAKDMIKKYTRLSDLLKVSANGFYGTAGLRTSQFYNLYMATSITLTAQMLISTAAMAFESFFGNNVKFQNIDECIVFITQVVMDFREEGQIEYLEDLVIDKPITIEEVLEKLRGTFIHDEDFINNTDILIAMLSQRKQQELNRIYYKNNLLEFCSNTVIKDIIRQLFLSVDKAMVIEDFDKDKAAKTLIETLWGYLNEYVFHNHMIFERITRLKSHPRERVIIIDTDSNMLNMGYWKRFVVTQALTPEDIATKEVYDSYFTIMNMGAYLIDRVITNTLRLMSHHSNINYEEAGYLLKMKNEFLYTLMLLTSSKKNYAGIFVLKEGIFIYPARLDMKGIQIKKSTISKEVSKKFVDILENDILRTTDESEVLTQKNIDVPNILRKLETIENDVIESINRGEKTYLKPMSVKDISAYDSPFSEMGIRAVIAWNALSDNNKIQLPDKFRVMKCKLTTLKDLLELAKVNEDAYRRLKEKIFDNENESLARKGVDVIAIPRTEKTIPEYLIPFIDTDTIIEDNFNNIIQILESLGLETIRRTSDSTFPSNCVEF